MASNAQAASTARVVFIKTPQDTSEFPLLNASGKSPKDHKDWPTFCTAYDIDFDAYYKNALAVLGSTSGGPGVMKQRHALLVSLANAHLEFRYEFIQNENLEQGADYFSDIVSFLKDTRHSLKALRSLNTVDDLKENIDIVIRTLEEDQIQELFNQICERRRRAEYSVTASFKSASPGSSQQTASPPAPALSPAPKEAASVQDEEASQGAEVGEGAEVKEGGDEN